MSRQHRPLPHPATLVSYFFNLSNRKNDFSISGQIEIQAEIFRLYFRFWPERRGQIFLGGSRSKSRNSGRILPTIFQLSASKKCRKFFFDKMYSLFRHKRTEVVRRRMVSLVLNLIFFVSFENAERQVACGFSRRVFQKKIFLE